eukprot:477757-Ditylum_brightwellii.AAC.1
MIVVPDKGIFGAENSLIYMIKEFRKNIVPCLDPTAADHLQRLHDLFGQCLQGAAATKWTAVLDKFPLATRTNITFKEAQKAYLEKIAEVTNFGDMLICQLQNNGKPAFMRKTLRLSLAINPNVIKPSKRLIRRRKTQGFFNGCHLADEADGTYTAVIKNQHDSKHARNRKESSKQVTAPREQTST